MDWARAGQVSDDRHSSLPLFLYLVAAADVVKPLPPPVCVGAVASLFSFLFNNVIHALMYTAVLVIHTRSDENVSKRKKFDFVGDGKSLDTTKFPVNPVRSSALGKRRRK